MKQFLKQHSFIFLFAFVIGALIVFPTIFVISKIGPDFKGVFPMFNNDETHYIAMTREAYDGHYNFGNVYLKEHKDQPYITPSLAEIILAFEAKLIDLSIPASAAINDFLLPFIGVVALYFLILQLAESGVIASIFSALYYLLFIFYFNRPINPQFSSIFLFLGLFLVLKIISDKEKTWKQLAILNFILAVVSSAVLYIYPYCWAAILAVYCLVLFFLAIKEKRIVYYFKNFLLFIIPAALFITPYFLNLKKAELYPDYIDIWFRFGFLLNHYPAAYFNVSLIVAGLAIWYFIGKGADYKKNIFVYSLVLGGLALNWQNVLTGKALSFSTHYYPIIVLFLFLIFASCASIIWKNYKSNILSAKNYLAVILILLLLSFLFYRERKGIEFGPSWFIMPRNISAVRDWQKLSGVADWFNDNSPKNSAVYSLGKNYGWFIPIYTYNNVFWNPDVGRFLLSDDELENRWIIQNFFKKGIGSGYIEGENMNIWTNKFIERYQNEVIRNKILGLFKVKTRSSTLVPKEYVDRILKKIDFYRELGFEKSLKQYSADYILLDRNNSEYGYLEKEFMNYPFLELAAAVENNLIFKVIK